MENNLQNDAQKMIQAISELEAMGIEASWEFPGYIAVGEWAFGIEDNQLVGNTIEPDMEPAEGLRQDLPIAQAIESFLVGISPCGVLVRNA